jgi:hypothetical protein
MKETSNNQLVRPLLDRQLLSKCYFEAIISYNMAKELETRQHLTKKMLLGEPLRGELHVDIKNLDRLNGPKANIT